MDQNATSASPPGLRQLNRGTALALVVCAALVALCYFFVDEVVAFCVHKHQIDRYEILKWLTYPPPILQAWVPVVLVVVIIRPRRGKFCRWEMTLLAAGIAMVVADQFRQTLAYAFGRYWPDTWIDNNPSLILTGAYGFHPFHGGIAYASFPSGHMARMLAMTAVVWIAYPKWRWAGVIASLAIAVGLLGMNYHFVGDIVAGSFVGAVVGTYASYFSGLNQTPAQNKVADVHNGK